MRITPSEEVKMEPIDLSGKIKEHDNQPTEESFIKEGDIYINKLIDNCFYINEGVRYFLIYQIVDNATYGTNDAVSLKSLLMPITVKQDNLLITPEYNKPSLQIKTFNTLLFSKVVNPLIYLFAKESYNMLVEYKAKDNDNLFNEWSNLRKPELIDKLNEFFHTDFQFSDYLEKLPTEGRTIFKVKNERAKVNEGGCYISVNSKALENDSMTRAVLGCLLDMKNETKKKRIVFSYEQLISPWFWVDTIAAFFTKNNDFMKRFNKVRTLLISLSRLMDETTRKILNLKDEDKENTLTIIRYIMKNFNTLLHADSQNLDNKRLRLFEY